MFNRVIIYPYRIGSESAKLLAQALHSKCVRANGTYLPRGRDLIINWGSTTIPSWWNQLVASKTLNSPQYVANCIDKTRTLAILPASGIATVEATNSRSLAEKWLDKPQYKGHLNAVVCRTLVGSSGGKGIVLARTPDELVKAPLYTRYKPKQAEFRLHVFKEFGIVDAQQKRKANGFVDEGMNRYIRNHKHGWIFCRENVVVPEPVQVACIQAVRALKLDFGAVDVGWHNEYGLAIYEVNTAPGIEGQTLENYRAAFQRFLV